MKKIITLVSMFLIYTFLLSGCLKKASSLDGAISSSALEKQTSQSVPSLSNHSLMIYCGAGMAKPFQKIADTFTDSTGCKVDVTFANASQIQAQIKTSQTGDFFIAGSKEEVTPVADFVQSQTDLVKHIPVLAVAKSNPKHITGLTSLTQPNITLVIGDPASTPIGKIAQKACMDLSIYDLYPLQPQQQQRRNWQLLFQMGKQMLLSYGKKIAPVMILPLFLPQILIPISKPSLVLILLRQKI